MKKSNWGIIKNYWDDNEYIEKGVPSVRVMHLKYGVLGVVYQEDNQFIYKSNRKIKIPIYVLKNCQDLLDKK